MKLIDQTDTSSTLSEQRKMERRKKNDWRMDACGKAVVYQVLLLDLELLCKAEHADDVW